MLFRKKQKENEEIIYAPMAGNLIPVSKVADATFANEFLGKTVALFPTSDRVVAPFDGEVALLFNTLHAISIVSDTGIELLIHVGLETVGLKGKPFQAYVKTGDRVKAGELLLEFDVEAIRLAGCDMVTPIVITNSEQYADIVLLQRKAVMEMDELLRVVR